MLGDMFKKNTYTYSEKKRVMNNQKVRDNLRKEQIPDGLFQKCDACGKIIYSDDIVENNYICSECGNYFRIMPYTRISMIVDNNTFEEWDKKMDVPNPIEFPEYERKINSIKSLTGLEEAVITGQGKIDGVEVAIGVMASGFMMGSMGSVVGEKLTRMVEKATKKKLPVIIFCCSGGARMQEGIVSLMQMTKVSQALKRHDEAGLLYISVLTDPTTGGVTASFAMLGDVIIAEPGALIGFAGPRVIQQTIKQKLPEGFQSAEFLLEHGLIDKIVKRKNLKKVLRFLVGSQQVKDN